VDFSRLAGRFTDWTQRWIPDAFVFALVATVIAVAGGLAVTGGGLQTVVESWGKGFWELIPFTLQMALVIITGYVVASTRPVHQLISWLAGVPKTPRGAVAFVAAFAMLSAWLNWGFSLIFSAVLAKEVARRVDADYRALAASSFLGLGSIWAQGLSGSAALQMATPGALQPAIREVVAHGGMVPGGLVPFTHTIFLWQSLLSVAVEVVLVTAVMYGAAPTGARIATAKKLGIDLAPLAELAPEKARVPGEWLEHSPLLTVLVVLLGGGYLVLYFVHAEDGLNAITLNTVNLFFLLVGFALHGTPARLMRAVRDATPAVWGVILQFPFYAGIAGIITGTQLNHHIAHFFVSISTPRTFPAVVAVYSALLGVFVPSGGSKWVIEAPYIMAAAHELKVHLGWAVAVYDLGEALANLVQPFWMLPILGLLGLKARDVMGYTLVVFLVLLPVVLIQVTVLGATLPYPL
jgi:short-chain fatty acids transporter